MDLDLYLPIFKLIYIILGWWRIEEWVASSKVGDMNTLVDNNNWFIQDYEAPFIQQKLWDTSSGGFSFFQDKFLTELCLYMRALF